MCGIYGVVSSESPILCNIGSQLFHRGPDYNGEYKDSDIIIGHTLLSIRGDEFKSRQPCSDGNSPWVMAFNGQLYNTKEIKDIISKKFCNEEIDTVLLYELIKIKGWHFINYIEGMFSIVLYNKDKQKIRFYRDGSGQKHLYYHISNHKLSFASEIEALLEMPHISRDCDFNSVQIACSIGYLPGNKTIVRNVSKLLPSEQVEYDLVSYELKSKFFNQECLKEKSVSLEEQIGLHFQSARPMALNLSGGLDSSILLHEAFEHGKKITTYTSFYEDGNDQENSEALLARKLSEDYNTDHNEIALNKKIYLQNLVEGYQVLDEPNYNVSIPLYHYMAKKQGVNGDGFRVLFSGDGGDEVFYGYPFYDKSHQIDRLTKILGYPLFNLIYKVKNGRKIDFSRVWDRWLFFKGWTSSFCFEKNDKNTLLEYLKKSLSSTFTNQIVDHNDRTYQLLVADRLTWLAAENFVRLDKLYMNQSMEVRAPFAYTPLRQAVDLKISTLNYSEHRKHKAWLRRQYIGKLPDYITSRKDKVGWRGPMHTWYDDNLKHEFLNVFNSMPKSSLIDWCSISDFVSSTNKWPGKQIHLYLSLALIANKLNLNI